METLGTKIKKSRKELGDHGLQLVTDTKVASKNFVSFMHEEAKDWGEYFKARYQNIEEHGLEALRPENPRDNIWAHLDGLIGKLSRHQKVEEEADETPTSEQEEPKAEAKTASDTALGDDFEEVNEEAVEQEEENEEVN
jgi:hypothetical protein